MIYIIDCCFMTDMEEYKVIDGVGIIPDGVSEIADDAFRGRMDLTEIVIPSSVTVIGTCRSAAFSNGDQGLCIQRMYCLA